ncbi:prenyltransferase [Sansalvadorimonas verongulae]|uniref:prenyltransferase n=1 Tax=Sansalvadorimonas verongulae TaxID=2172824 RepID=UPI0012BD02E0|nr:prenyltransferase [Sansalvadorimonas verongulae]MTI14360.1 prenyltransferase [Sansalvadorimonas verongulae]
MSADSVNLPAPSKYFFVRALRPFSLSVAVVACGLGIALAYGAGEGDALRATLVMIAGILLQAAVNLFNDYADLRLWANRDDKYASNIRNMIRKNMAIAKAITSVAAAIGIVLVYFAGWKLLLIVLLGAAGGYYYTGTPIAYKNRGLGVVGVFLFTGVLMVSGSYLAVTGNLGHHIFLYSIPVSMISSMLLLANELRDVDEDIDNDIGTFTVRMGYRFSSLIYILLGVAAIVMAFAIGLSGAMALPWLMLVPALVLKQPVALLRTVKQASERKRLVRLPPLTGRFFLIFGICFMVAI